MKTKENAQEWHPLLKSGQEIKFTISWEAMKKECEERGNLWDFMNLLHFGFNLEIENQKGTTDRICYYFEMAYCYNFYSSSIFHSLRPDTLSISFCNSIIDGQNPLNVYEEREKIAKKAWSILCQKIFKNTKGDDFKDPDWWWLCYDEDETDIFDKILWFFSEEDNIPSSDSENHNDKIAFEFLYRLCQYAWINHSGDKGHRNSPPLAHFVENRDKFIQILGNLGKLQFLINHWELVTDKDLKFLKKTALCRDANKPVYRTLEEAMVAGSKSAHAYFLISIMKAEKERQDKIEEAEEKIKEAKVQVKKLRNHS